MKRFNRVLEGAGLSEKETRVYLAISSLGEASVAAVSREASVKRPTTYLVLEELAQRGLCARKTSGRSTIYRALPAAILAEELDTKLSALRDVLPELESLARKTRAYPQLSIYEGKKGLTQIMEDTLKHGTEICGWADMDQATSGPLEDYYPKYIRKRVKNKIYVRAVFVKNKVGEVLASIGKSQLREAYLVSREDLPIRNEINIYADKIAIISHQDEVGVILQNKFMADSQRAIFNFVFRFLQSQRFPKI